MLLPGSYGMPAGVSVLGIVPQAVHVHARESTGDEPPAPLVLPTVPEPPMTPPTPPEPPLPAALPPDDPPVARSGVDADEEAPSQPNANNESATKASLSPTME